MSSPVLGVRVSHRTRTLLSASFALGVACCANLLAPARQTQPPAAAASDEWHLVFRMSGGFAGFNRELELANTGSVTAMDRKRGIQAMTKASAKELAEITPFLADLKPGDARRETNCRDCVEYSLDLRMNGRSLALRLNDSALPGSKVENLVKALTNLMNRALESRPAAQ